MRLKLNLNKTKMHTLIRLYDDSIPRKKDCCFTSHGGVYWMDYQRPGGEPVRITLLVALGVALMRIENPDTGDERTHQITTTYLQNEGMLKSA